MIGANRLLHEMDDMHSSVNRLEAELTSELENGRLVRLLRTFCFINERPMYIIKLFRDYVCHLVGENGNPVINLSRLWHRRTYYARFPRRAELSC
ncbi:hypothetical protein BD769DRAFT_1443412, partial [Suillus cothurnatus]